jgi:DNA topoisomerase-3
MVMTSVSGHLLGYEFASTFRSWKSCNPVALFDAPVVKLCPQDYQKIKVRIYDELTNL